MGCISVFVHVGAVVLLCAGERLCVSAFALERCVVSPCGYSCEAVVGFIGKV